MRDISRVLCFGLVKRLAFGLVVVAGSAFADALTDGALVNGAARTAAVEVTHQTQSDSVLVPKHALRFATALISPYQIMDAEGTLTGRSLPILACTMEALGYAYEVELLPWGRAQKNVELGISDAFFVASQNKVRDSYALISEPMFSGTRSWFFKAGNTLEIDQDEVRRRINVGTVFGTNMHSMLDSKFENVVTKTTESELVELLLAGRIDALLLTDDMFNYTLDQMKLDKARFDSLVASQRPLGIYFGKHFLSDKPELLERFNDALPACLNAQVEQTQ